MEQDNTQGEVNPAPQESAPETPAVQVQQVSEQKKPERNVRRNGRNKSGARSVAQKGAEAQTESCGEIEDLANFKEKLSGSNVSGYAEGEASEKSAERPFGKSRERRFDGDRPNRKVRDFERRDKAPVEQSAEEKPAEENAEVASENKEVKETSPEGPFFESKKVVSSRAVEVPLTDRRPKFSNEKSRDDGVVSYSSKGSECPSVSLFERIKNAIASIFGKKSDNGKKRFNKDHRHGDFKGHRHGGDRKPYNKDRRGGGDFKRRHNSDRRTSQNRRPRDNNRNTPEA